VFGHHIPLIMLTDSEQMFDVVTQETHTTEKRLMIDVAAASEAYGGKNISNVGICKSEHNTSDGLTKPCPSAVLDGVMHTSNDLNPVNQCIIRLSFTTGRSVRNSREC